ncbi:hypothetical protein PENARI_c014G05390 [Penicillium arizonense]|uniref:Uncharacterized protein n=1 Tax=Penicillium arizonense TaxID=1835702 RepID=A0A1F5LDC3_PENAI|nr:hypothetical protein PENARI_c014G05390 [Penicillium arizonense]OGE51224.1 hypothetical protein PENARI_c014G05390 [Penicillium arizonense]
MCMKAFELAGTVRIYRSCTFIATRTAPYAPKCIGHVWLYLSRTMGSVIRIGAMQRLAGSAHNFGTLAPKNIKNTA